jgi:hypothetical protein
MKLLPLRYLIILPLVLSAGCASTTPPAGEQAYRPDAASTAVGPCAPRADENAIRPGCDSKPPRLTVGVSDPDTVLILPWFLTDIVNVINLHGASEDCCLR